jgi:carboxymethylenebutenolidase
MGERVTFRANGTATPGYLARPKAPGPGIIVIQEWWGLVPQIERVADRFAEAGFAALAPDLYHGRTAAYGQPDQAGKMMMAMRVDEAERDLAAAIDYLAARAETSPKNIGTIGFCMGGALSLFAASKNAEVGACVVFYGGHPSIKPDLAALQAPVLGIFAGRDGFVTPQAVKTLDEELTRLGKRHEFHTYANADHAFFNEDRPEVYDPQASADAWNKTIAFFSRELKNQKQI